MKKKLDYIDYQKASKKLFKQLFGDEIYKIVNKSKMTAIDWKGVDIDECYDITKCTPNIKERFTQDNLDYFKERDYTLFDIYIQSVFHYGYAQKCNELKSEVRKDLIDDFNLLINKHLILITENEELKKELAQLKKIN